MPYIKGYRRILLEKDINNLIHRLLIITPSGGDLNYVFTRLALAYCKEQSYQKFQDVIGALECAKLELYRRQIGPYEDKKIDEYGDIE